MDFVTKKAFEAKLKNVGRDLGLSSNNGGSSAPPPWGIFSSSRDDDIAPDPESGRAGESESAQLSPSAAAYFDAQPNNYPPFVRLFFVDRTIIAPPAASAVTWAFRTAHLCSLLLLVNVSVNILVVALRDSAEGWHVLLIAAPVMLLLTGFQLVTAETAFRGTYRGSAALRGRYVALGALSLLFAIPYALLGSAFFNGWIRLASIGSDDALKSPTMRTLRRALAVAEAAGWTVALFLQTYALFEMYRVWKERVPGLADHALAAARGLSAEAPAAARAPQRERERERERGPPPPPASRVGGSDLEARERLEHIKQKYGARQAVPRT